MSAETNNVTMEKSVLGAMLVSEPATSRVIDESPLGAEDFYLDRHRTIFGAIAELHAADKPCDELTVGNAIAATGKTEEAGGKNYLSELASACPAPGNVRHYAEIVFDLALKRAARIVALELEAGRITATEAVDQLSEIENRRSAADEDGMRTMGFDTIAREKVKWLWKERIPLGMLTLLMGDPGLGKSLFTTYLAAPVSRAGAGVLMLTGEDDPAATIRPRLEAANADLTRVRNLVVRRDGMDEGLALPDDGAELQRQVREHAIKLIIVDPLMAFLPESVNSWKDQSVRRAIAPLYAIARDERCAVVIVAHLNKGRQGNALHRAGGSIGIPAAVRSALLLARDPLDPEPERGGRRVLAHVKCNVGPQRESLTCEVVPIVLDDGEEVPTLRITGTSETTAAELLDTPDASEAPERDEAEQFLLVELADGPRAAKEMTKLAREQGISERTLKRARATLGVKSKKGGTKGWNWSLVEGGQPPSAESKGATEVEGGQPYIRPVAPFSSRAKNKEKLKVSEGEGGHEIDIGPLALVNQVFPDAEEVSA